MYDKEHNQIKMEYIAFHIRGWRAFTNEPKITFSASDGHSHVEHFLTMQDAEDLIDLIKSAMDDAKAQAANENWSPNEDTPF